ncbi:MAG: TylF/MycF/NovP-related O-methyltransferase [Candidatus Binataceae bacterium]
MRQRAKLSLFFRRQFRADSLTTWFLRGLRSQHRRRRGPRGNYYEFGVGRCRTLIRYLKALQLHCELEGVDFYSHHIFAFDSFAGLPPTDSPRDAHPGWHEGQFKVSLAEVRARIGSRIDLDRGTVRFIEGFFERSLTPELARELAEFPPSIVTIDVDYYTSTKAALD